MEEKKYKYNCEQCNFNCDTESKWNIHKNTVKHKTGERKKRSDTKDPYECEDCDYKTKNKTTLKQHILNEHSDKNKRESEFRYYCKLCDYGTFSVDLYNFHKSCRKHKKNEKIE